MESKLYSYNGSQILSLLNASSRAHNRTLECYQNECEPVMVLHLGTIEHSQYYVEVGETRGGWVEGMWLR